MLKHKDHFHGSDLEQIELCYGIKKEDIVSFSANVNPKGISPLLSDAEKGDLMKAVKLLPGEFPNGNIGKIVAEDTGNIAGKAVVRGDVD